MPATRNKKKRISWTHQCHPLKSRSLSTSLHPPQTSGPLGSLSLQTDSTLCPTERKLSAASDSTGPCEPQDDGRPESRLSPIVHYPPPGLFHWSLCPLRVALVEETALALRPPRNVQGGGGGGGGLHWEEGERWCQQTEK